MLRYFKFYRICIRPICYKSHDHTKNADERYANFRSKLILNYIMLSIITRGLVLHRQVDKISFMPLFEHEYLKNACSKNDFHCWRVNLNLTPGQDNLFLGYDYRVFRPLNHIIALYTGCPVTHVQYSENRLRTS